MIPEQDQLTDISGTAAAEVPARIASHYPLMPMGVDREGSLRVAVSKTTTVEMMDEIRVVLNRDVAFLRVPESEIRKALKVHYGVGADTLERLSEETVDPATSTVTPINDLDATQEASVMKFVNQTLLEAYRTRATDIHLEPYQDELRIRYRIDGVLYDTKIPDSLKRFQSVITSRVKVMADLSIAEKRMPQDGRIAVRVDGQPMDLRVSTLPTPFGESVGIRLLTSRQFLDLEHLGFYAEDLKRLTSFVTQPHGIIFLTGPTGSGKTTTLYAFLQKINQSDKKIITLEDPIEYQMKGITQMQVHTKIGLTFGQGLRAMLRHDPDVMMVGEVRDLETAEIAIRVALTGHLVFSTLHTNDASGAVTRLQDIGVEPYLISSSVLCVIAQRLVRLLCAQCKTKQVLSPEVSSQFGVENVADTTVYTNKGCEACHGTGFRGRTVIYEILPITSAIQRLITERKPAHLIREQALQEGMRTLRQCGWKKICEGGTTPEEVLRATLQEGF